MANCKHYVIHGIAIATRWKIDVNFMECNLRSTSRAESVFRCHTFLPNVDTAMAQLENRFEGQKFVLGSLTFLFPHNLIKLTKNQIQISVKKFADFYSKDFNHNILLVELRSLEELSKMSTVIEISNLLLSSKLRHRC